jgi:hypothetical protein
MNIYHSLTYNQKVGLNVRIQRIKQDKTRKWLARSLHYCSKWMASVESGDRALKVNEIAIIAELLGCKVDLLYPATSWRSSIYSLLEYDKKVGWHVRLRRESLNLSRINLGECLGLNNYESVLDIEHGRRSLNAEELEAIADFLQCDRTYLLP